VFPKGSESVKTEEEAVLAGIVAEKVPLILEAAKEFAATYPHHISKLSGGVSEIFVCDKADGERADGDGVGPQDDVRKFREFCARATRFAGVPTAVIDLKKAVADVAFQGDMSSVTHRPSPRVAIMITKGYQVNAYHNEPSSRSPSPSPAVITPPPKP
jgi:hypothetical protein